MLLRLQVVPPPEPEQHRPREPQKEEETAPKKEAKKTPAEEGPDEVKEQLLRENTILREENLALKVSLETPNANPETALNWSIGGVFYLSP